MMDDKFQFPYGAVYFRKTNPPKEDWERDYQTAAEDGLNAFRHWFMWGAIEIAPGVFDWDDYDRQMDLAAKYGIKTIIAEQSICVPEWVAAKYPELLMTDHAGNRRYPIMNVSCAVGGYGGGLCLDKKASRELTQNFLTKLVERYKDHPALYGYDIANELASWEGSCYCEDTMAVYRSWLQKKYGDIRALCQAWKKYSYTSFDEVRSPEQMGYYPESVDWLEFSREHFMESAEWKAGIVRTLDPRHKVIAHGIARTITHQEEHFCDDWRGAAMTDIYGCTWVSSRNGNEPWRQCSALDVVRAASRGKNFWHAESQGGPLWLQPQLTGRAAEDGRVSKPGDIRTWNMISLACGAKGIFNPRFRPLLDGPLFGAFGAYGMDGSRTDRSAMASKMAKWLNHPDQKELLAANPVRGQIGLLHIPESSTASYLHKAFGNKNLYPYAVYGAYQGFFDNNIQSDFIRFENIDEVDTLYLAHPIALTQEHAACLKKWVAEGGTLISESCPGYWTKELHVHPTQPGFGLDELFGVREKNVEFMPDIENNLEMVVAGHPLLAGGYLQYYELTTAKAAGFFRGQIIAAENHFGKGKTLLIGANPSINYNCVHDEATRDFYAWLLQFAGKAPDITVSDHRIIARVHQNGGRKYLWLVNPTADLITATIRVTGCGALGKVFWNDGRISAEEGTIQAEIPALNGMAAELRDIIVKSPIRPLLLGNRETRLI